MNLLAAFKRPEYLNRPSQILRRLTFRQRAQAGGYEMARLPWGPQIRVKPAETIGSAISRLGLHDLPSSECVGRLIDPGELVVDVGANIGQITCMMAARTGKTGKVMSFEPNPVVYGQLQFNVDSWSQNPNLGRIALYRLALSDRAGVAELFVPKSFDWNSGMSSLTESDEHRENWDKVEVQVSTLDSILSDGQTIGLMKIDVEEHELSVLNGATSILDGDRVRDIIFEEQHKPPTPVTELLRAKGYQVYRIEGKFSGPVIVPYETLLPITVGDSPNYLATRNPARALARLSERGWKVYSRGWSV